ncbi:MAG: nucleoside triphosphate pyrophosphohydrolase [Deltaproteobacteria bacterium]|nr:nucleoside triphosphate pyrophosphohydrolase [Deltaproteobacteria bacterium]
MEQERLYKALSALTGLVSRLRGPGGCPWDARQTDSTVKMYLIEEAYEVTDAIEKGDYQEICEELGDLLFQIVFLTEMADERGEFNLNDVLEGITDKMIKRHPHVFGDVRVESAEEVSDNWEKIKRDEKGAREKTSSMLKNVPMNLPALLRAHRLSQRAAKSGFDWAGRAEILEKVKEEYLELEESIKENNREQVGEELGDLLFSLVNLARHWGFNAEDLLRSTNRKFIRRYECMEDDLASDGIGILDATVEEMNRSWDKIKMIKE